MLNEKFPRKILESYAGKYSKLFVFLGDNSCSVCMALIEPILGIVLESNNEEVILFENHKELTSISLADPDGANKIESMIGSILKKSNPKIYDCLNNHV